MGIKLVCALGRTCSGKDSLFKDVLVDDNISDKYEMVVSYTTRPMRESETEGVEHHFVTEEKFREDNSKGLLAFTAINGYKYYVPAHSITEIVNNGKIPVYIIDPIGLKDLYKNLPKYTDISSDNIYSIYIYAKESDRIVRYIQREELRGTLAAVKDFYSRSRSENDQFSNFETVESMDEYVDLFLDNSSNSKYNSFDMNISMIKTVLGKLWWT